MACDKTNLLSETIASLTAASKTPADVLWVGALGNDLTQKTSVVGSWEDFARFADFNYNSGFGGAEVNCKLVVAGNGWWLERGEYDGSEWWEFKTLPAKPVQFSPLRAEDLK